MSARVTQMWRDQVPEFEPPPIVVSAPRVRRWVDTTTGVGRRAITARHAILIDQGVAGEVTTLCGQQVTVTTFGGYSPECAACDRLWRVAENIPKNPFR